MKLLYALKCLFIFFVCFPASVTTIAQTTLSPGDIAFTGYNADDNTVNGVTANDDFSFVLLRSITSGTVIYFTDFGWRSDINGFQDANSCGPGIGALSDGVIQWTATANMNYGEQVTIRCKVSPTADKGTVTGFQSTFNSATEYISLATGGDEVFAFQGTLGSPTLIAGIGMNGPWDVSVIDCTFSSSASTLPVALNSNNYAFNIDPEIDNARLNASVTLTGTAATDRAAIANLANWDVDNTNAFALPAPISSLPVTFIQFTARPGNGQVTLNWKVADEINLQGYRAERSADGQNWQVISFITATGGPDYRYPDGNPLQGKNFYRIRSVDLDGSYKFSRVISVYNNATSFHFSAAPNPSRNYLDIQVQSPAVAKITLRLINTQGLIMLQKDYTLPAGVQVIRLEALNKFPAGIYFLQVTTPGALYRQRISLAGN